MIINNETKKIRLEDLGYTQFFASSRHQLGLDDFQVARVTAEYQGAYRVKNENGEYLARVTGKQMFSATSREDYPAVGDFVAITELNKEQAVIHRVLPRRTIIKRKDSGKNEIQIMAANVDTAFVIESVDRDYNLNRLERYFAIARSGGVEPAVILNKTDLISKEELNTKTEQIKNRLAQAGVIPTSAVSEQGLDELKRYLEKGKTYCFLGSSGVGKSSLINKLLGTNNIKTRGVSLHSGRGTHTTTNREMYFLPGGSIVIDSPGMREVGITDAGDSIDNVFDEILALAEKCKFKDCSHTHEPGCEVLSAVNSNRLDKGKYSNYLNLKKEAAHYGMTELEKREKNRKFGKFIKKAKEGLKKHGHKGYF